MHFEHADTRNFGPGLVRVRVIVQELVPEHQSHCEQSVLAAGLALNCRIQLFEPVDKEKSQ